jgi:hypothetical protein
MTGKPGWFEHLMWLVLGVAAVLSVGLNLRLSLL